ncbi:PREDICTED: vacuolar protein-sorting-associated protein 36-like [Acropora digitifera]|uniref:vacuolar protein-sorting-associated protein 36-like n=1 Tax=Acropora digitifera TaxID=70779 RepID=UPI00077AB973|nr:PREDICTED: vacuolar protein-sorting-associated protein 36-like [Acropora digitifera]
MDRFSWTSPSTPCVLPGESGIHRQSGVRIYDGDKKTTFDNGDLKLTTHRLVWNDLDQQDRAISLSLSLVSKVTEQSSGFMSSAKVVVELHPSPANKEPGPCVSSSYSCVKFSFKQGGHSEFLARLVEQVNKKPWTPQTPQSSSLAGTGPSRTRGIGGIVGIERKLEEKSKETDNYIQKVKKSQQPVNDVSFLKDEGGMMALSDVYCRFNRARGMELVSPDDLINAANIFVSVNIPLRLRRFESGVLVIQALTHSDEEVIRNTKQILDEKESVTAEELAHLSNISVMLARERLLVTEQAGKACRDDSVEGLRFYPNRFLEREG